MAQPRDRLHILLPDAGASEPFRAPRTGGGANPPKNPPEDRAAHGATLRASLVQAVRDAEARRKSAPVAVDPKRSGLFVVVESTAKEVLDLASLEARAKGVEVVACVREEDVDRATVFVPDSARRFFLDRLAVYETSTGAKGETNYRATFDRVATLRLATLRGLWTDDPDTFPAADTEAWWEVWLRRSDGREVERFHTFAAATGVVVGARRLDFDDRIVIVARATAAQLASSVDVLGDLGELRRARETPRVFDAMPSQERRQWVDEAARGVQPPGPDAPAVCVFDTGVHQPHPLLSPALAPGDCHVVDPTWARTDTHGHGTQMAGLALHGDLVDTLLSSGVSALGHCLESVKILDPPRANRYDLYGSITIDAVACVEIGAPTRRRCFSMAITEARTEEEQRRRPRAAQPTSWSATIDALSAGRVVDPSRSGPKLLSGKAPRRLFVISAGNVSPERAAYLDVCDVEPVEDPAHAWNALTVGACTHLTQITEPRHLEARWKALAPAGDLSPYSRTGMTLERTWPIKPDVVFEGGNAAVDPVGNVDFGLASLSVLTTGLPGRGLLDVSFATSAATAQVARLAASVSAEYPSLWPETIRALVVHSARWTSAMRAHLPTKLRKKDAASLVRRYGHGIPSRERATRSARDALTLIVQGTLRPYLPDGSPEMHLHELPWPRAALQALGEATVTLRVTLSYFIEPNPARRGWRSRFRYASHGLRFDLKDATETVFAFQQRINVMAREEPGAKTPKRASDSAWFLGPKERHRGSLHSDTWVGAAAKLADRHCVGVFPAAGWWKDVAPQRSSERVARYALVVSIEAEDVPVEIDLYTPVATQVGVSVPVEV